VRKSSTYTTLTTTGQKKALTGGAIATALLLIGTAAWHSKRQGQHRGDMY